MIKSMIIFIFFIFVSNISLSLSESESEIVVLSYVTTDVGNDCLTVCSELGLKCYDNFLQDMSCQKAAKETCSSSSSSSFFSSSSTSDLDDTSGNYHCDKGGCYVACNHGVYANRGTQYWTCNTQPICHTTVGSSDRNFYGYDQVCACADVQEEDTAFHLYVWQIVGICLFFTCCALGSVQLIAIFFPHLFPSKEMYQKMKISDTATAWTETATGLLIRMKHTGDTMKSRLFKKFSETDDSIHSSIDGSEDGVHQEDAEQKARKERKERRASKKKKGSHTALSLSDMDDSVNL